jgi:hypothetical protein
MLAYAEAAKAKEENPDAKVTKVEVTNAQISYYVSTINSYIKNIDKIAPGFGQESINELLDIADAYQALIGNKAIPQKESANDMSES